MFQEFSQLPGSSKFGSVSISKVLSHILFFFSYMSDLASVLVTSNERARTRKKAAVPSLS